MESSRSRRVRYNDPMEKVRAEPFIDEVEIRVEAGHGGAGAVSFRREAHVPRGGPDGGDGGKGGDVVFIATSHLNTLNPFRRQRRARAEAGHGGGTQRCSGSAGADVVVQVPIGTIVEDRDTGEILHDFSHDGEQVVIAAGGRGGLGNWHFRSSVNRTPRHAQPGEPGEERNLRLELRLLADVGLVGYPNAGKSSLIRRLTRARPKVGDYPFTTLVPNLGVVEDAEGDGFVIADVPGLIEGAAEGAGLGHGFLRHLARTRLLVHVVDAADGDDAALIHRVEVIEGELARSPTPVAAEHAVLVLHKADLVAPADRPEREAVVRGHAPGAILWVSSVSGEGLGELRDLLARRLGDLRAKEAVVVAEASPQPFAGPELDVRSRG
jgi:GTP-binding protein